MNLGNAISRAARGFRDDLKLHLLAIISLVVAFVCLGTALLSVENLGHIASRFSSSRHLTVYLRDGSNDDVVAQLRLVLESLDEVENLEYVSKKRAQAEFAQQVDLGGNVDSLPSEAFPASMEISLADGTSQARVDGLAQRIRGFDAVDDVETYRDWFGQVDTLLSAGRSATGFLALLVAVCVVAVIGNTIRLAVMNRRQEIEVLRLCGATDGFVRMPFLLEGVFQGLSSCLLALLLLVGFYFALRGEVESTMLPLVGVRTTFLQPLTALLMVTFGAVAGGVGSALSLRRYMAI